MGTLWNKPVIIVNLHPARYTREFLSENDSFTVSFFPESRRKALAIMGSCSGRDGDKVSAAGLTPVSVGDSVGYKEANLTFLCRKLYQHQLSKEYLAPEICAYYQANPGVYPPDEDGEWQAHWVFVGEIIETIE
jgi:flavin reductase (DIM6/NTAB) family NADH-FMN oxidoreductase RutF